MQKQKNNQRGITLIALVVTIIVLIILAGVSINMLVGENGIIRQAQSAKEETKQSQQNEMADLQKLNDYIDVATGNKTYISQIDCWGDSLTAGAGGNGTTYPTVLNSLLGNDYVVTNYGVGGEGSQTIAGRQGGIPYIVADSFTIPADLSAVNITLKSSNGSNVAPLRQGDAGVNTVIIGGIEGTISIEQDDYWSSNYSYKFTRKEMGEAINIEAGTEIITNASRNNSNHTLIIWMGQNGGYNEDANILIEQYRSMINKNGNDNYIIIGIPTGTKDSRSELETAMKNAFGNKYINIREYMTKPIYENDILISCQALQDCNLTATDEDLQLIEQGTIPATLRTDSIHGNSFYYTIVAQQVYKKGVELGYWNENNKESYILASAATETSTTSGFLGNTRIQRKDINSITFCESIEEAKDKSNNSEIKWNVDTMNLGDIIAYAKIVSKNGQTIYDIYIGSDGNIYANNNCAYLFANIGKNEECTDEKIIYGIEKINTSNVTNMNSMFANFGQVSLKVLDLGNNFDTSNVTNMMYMFYGTGTNTMTELKLGDKFNTQKVTNMNNMFYMCGNNKLLELNLGNLFDTSKVTNMDNMFAYCGYNSMTTLNLGTAFKNISSINTNIFLCGKNCTIMCPSDIYYDNKTFKLNNSVDTENTNNLIEYTRGSLEVL